MAIVTIVFGSLLFVLGIVSYIATGSTHMTALIPSAFGLVFELLGVLALKPNLRKHAMHAAALLAVVGFLGTVRGVGKAITLMQGSDVERPQAAVAQSVMALLCLVFLALCVNSFVAARRNR
jgi:hypothetical protein